jgi:hypothetical protein
VAAAADLDIHDGDPLGGTGGSGGSGGSGGTDGPDGYGPAADDDVDEFDTTEVAARFSGDNPPEPPTLL